MSDSAESHARKALARFRRAVEKATREIEALEGALARAEGADFPRDAYDRAVARLDALVEFTDEEAARLDEKILQSGGLEPGRIRRSSG